MFGIPQWGQTCRYINTEFHLVTFVDLKQQTLALIARLSKKRERGTAASTVLEEPPLFQTAVLRQTYDDLFEDCTVKSSANSSSRPRKRARTSTTCAKEEPFPTTDPVSKVCEVLGMKDSNDINALRHEARYAYPKSWVGRL